MTEEKYNELYENVIPNNVIDLTLFNFNKLLKIGDLPPKIKVIDFNDDYNQPINKDVLPKSITHLYFGYLFKQPLDNILSDNLVELILYCHNYPNKILNNYIHYFYDYIGDKYDNRYINYKGIEIEYRNKMYIDKKIVFLGKIIFEELVSKVFNPNRLLKLCNIYNISFDEINDCY